MATLLAATAVAAPPQLEGQWTGREDGPKNSVTLYVRGQGLVYIDKKEVLLGKWKMASTPTPQGNYSIDLYFSRITDHTGTTWVAVEGQQATSLGMLRLTKSSLRLCLSQPGSTARAGLQKQLNPDKGIVRCFDLTRPYRPLAHVKPHRSRALCIRQCILDNQMRAVSAQMIKDDCKRSCEVQRAIRSK